MKVIALNIEFDSMLNFTYTSIGHVDFTLNAC